MKKLFYTLLFSILLFATKGFAQCTIINPTVDIISTTSSGGNCVLEFDLSFEIDNNSGNKYIYIHIWPLDNYPSPSLTYTDAPTGADLSGSLVNLVIDNFSATPELLDTYKPAPSITVQDPSSNPSISLVITPGTPFNTYTISGIKLTTTGACSSTLQLRGDAWSSQANNQNSVVHCFETGFEIGLNDPLVTGFCVSGFPGASYNFNISTTTPSADVYYDVYIDNGDGIFVSSSDLLIAQKLVGDAVTITPSTPFNSGNLAYPVAYDNITYANRKVFVAVRTIGRNYILLEGIDACTAAIFDFGDLPTVGTTSWPEARVKIIGNYSAIAPFIISNSVINNNAVWAGSTISVRGFPYSGCINGEIPIGSCDKYDDGFAMPMGPLTGGITYPFSVTVNSNLSGTTVYYGFWIDWNNNGNFADDVDFFGNPSFYSGNTTTMSPRTVSVNVTPSNDPLIVSHQYKVRLIVSASPITSAMYNSTTLVNGEVEDYLSPQPIVLPLKFGEIKTENKDCAVEISFLAQNEVNNKFFRIEQSTNGIDWHVIATLQSKGSGDNNYRFIHESASPGTNYYKVQQVDADSRYSYSEVFSAKRTCDADVVMGPNPVLQDLTIRVPLDWRDVRYTLFSTTGQKIFSRLAPRGGTILLPTHNLAAGTYSVQITTPGNKPLTKVIVKL